MIGRANNRPKVKCSPFPVRNNLKTHGHTGILAFRLFNPLEDFRNRCVLRQTHNSHTVRGKSHLLESLDDIDNQGKTAGAPVFLNLPGQNQDVIGH